MKNWLTGLRIGLGVCAALGWWGFLYPELTMTPDTYRITMEEKLSIEEKRSIEDGTVQKVSEVVEWDFDSDVYWSVLNADRSQIRFKSKLLQTAAELLENR